MMNAKVIDLISLEYSALEHLLNRHDIEANFRKPDTDESDLQVMQRFHRRNTAPKPALATNDTPLVFFSDKYSVYTSVLLITTSELGHRNYLCC